jgi:hypothetical protein
MSSDSEELPQKEGAAIAFCQLARDGFTGIVYAEADGGGAIFSWRHGRPVFVEDLGGDSLTSDAWVAPSLMSAQQFGEVAAVLEPSVENENLAFAKQAVKLGMLSQQQVDAEFERRLRGRFIQAVGWVSCRIELDADPDAIAATPEYPQSVGPLVLTAVRTFFDEARIRTIVGDYKAAFVNVTHPRQDVAGFLELEPEERALLMRLQPDLPVIDALQGAGMDAVDGWNLICTLVLAGLAEVAGSPFARTVERPRVGPLDATRARVVVAREETGPAQRQRVPVAREEVGPSRPLRPAAVQAEPEQRRRGADMRESPARVQQPTDSVRKDADSVVQGRPVAPQERRSVAQSPPTDPGRVGSVEPAKPTAQAPRPPVRKLGAALKQLDRELRQLRTVPSVAVQPPAANPASSQNRAHLEQLMRMRNAKLQQEAQDASMKQAVQVIASEAFRAAQEALREQQFAKAHELLTRACEAEPGNPAYGMYCMWAAFRSGVLAEAGVNELRTVLRANASEHDHKAFAHYALGHLALAEKKDETAERFFQKAIELDKNNKDAQRHLRLIGLRRKTAASDEKGSKFFGIDIRAKKT